MQTMAADGIAEFHEAYAVQACSVDYGHNVCHSPAYVEKTQACTVDSCDGKTPPSIDQRQTRRLITACRSNTHSG